MNCGVKEGLEGAVKDCPNDNGGLTLRIDTKYYRIGIHKQTLEAVGAPEFIRLGYEPKTRQLMVLGAGSDMYKAVRVRFSSSGPFYIYCKGLITALQSAGRILEKEGSYLVYGKLREGGSGELAVTFPMKDAELSPAGAEWKEDLPKDAVRTVDRTSAAEKGSEAGERPGREGSE